jgi:hypothetical protein
MSIHVLPVLAGWVFQAGANGYVTKQVVTDSLQTKMLSCGDHTGFPDASHGPSPKKKAG